MALKEKTKQELPHWDVSTVFSSLESAEFNKAFTALVGQIANLKEIFDGYEIAGGSEIKLDDETTRKFEEIIGKFNSISDDYRTISAYIYAFVTTDTRNNIAQARLSELEQETIVLGKLGIRFQAWVGAMDVESLIGRSKAAVDHSFAVRKAYKAARYQMQPGEEELYADLSVTGGNAWGKLHGNLTSQLTASVTRTGGEVEELPMSSVRNLAHDPDEEVRRAGYQAEIAAWQSVAVPLAAALNSIKGETNTVAARRGWKDALEAALFSNNVDRETLDAMQTACVESFPDFRRYLRAKARLLGKQKLAWWDLFAPVGGRNGHKEWSYSDATAFIVEQFGTFSDRMAGLADRAFKERWIDAEPRVGKVDGAFCMGLRGDESRVLANFEPSFDSVHTLAHELGHAYHNLNLASQTPFNRRTPMALAETASIFCQTIITNAALSDVSDSEKVAILENELMDSCQVVLDIHSRFLFEKGVFEARAKRELSVDEFKELMLDSQRQTYGDGLDGDALHPYMWAVKGHYYGSSYYNWPYTFGLLFGLGLYAQYRQDPDGFRGGYDDLLASTGLDDAAGLTARFGFDIKTPDFWRSSLDLIRERIAEFEKLSG